MDANESKLEGKRILFCFKDFYNDHRKQCYLYISDTRFKLVQDLLSHIKLCFKISEDIFLTEQDYLLPSFEVISVVLLSKHPVDVRRLSNDESHGGASAARLLLKPQTVQETAKNSTENLLGNKTESSSSNSSDSNTSNCNKNVCTINRSKGKTEAEKNRKDENPPTKRLLETSSEDTSSNDSSEDDNIEVVSKVNSIRTNNVVDANLSEAGSHKMDISSVENSVCENTSSITNITFIDEVSTQQLNSNSEKFTSEVKEVGLNGGDMFSVPKRKRIRIRKRKKKLINNKVQDSVIPLNSTLADVLKTERTAVGENYYMKNGVAYPKHIHFGSDEEVVDKPLVGNSAKPQGSIKLNNGSPRISLESSEAFDTSNHVAEQVAMKLFSLQSTSRKPPVFERKPKVNKLISAASYGKNNTVYFDNTSTPQSLNCSPKSNKTALNSGGSMINTVGCLNVDDVTASISQWRVGNIINFRILVLDENYTPTLSGNIVGKIITLAMERIHMKILEGNEYCKPLNGKFSLEDDNDESVPDVIELFVKDLIQPVVLS